MPPPSYSPGGVGRYGGDIGRYKGDTREIQGRSRGGRAPGAAAVVLGGRRERDVEGEEGKVDVHLRRCGEIWADVGEIVGDVGEILVDVHRQGVVSGGGGVLG